VLTGRRASVAATSHLNRIGRDSRLESFDRVEWAAGVHADDDQDIARGQQRRRVAGARIVEAIAQRG
jgi:hypothetical protein